MIKITFILSFLLAGMASFAGQSAQQSIQTNNSQSAVMVICTVTAWVGNVRIQSTAADCATALKNIQPYKINLATLRNGSTSFPSSGNNGSFLGNTALP